MLFLFVLSAIGLIYSLVAHLVTFFGINLAGYAPAIWGLHLGVFVILIPASFMEPLRSAERNSNGWHNLMLPVPEKAKKILRWYPWYLALNFIVAILASFLTNKEVNQNQEGWAQIFNLHIASAFWIYFYFFATVIFWYHNKRNEKIARKKHLE